MERIRMLYLNLLGLLTNQKGTGPNDEKSGEEEGGEDDAGDQSGDEGAEGEESAEGEEGSEDAGADSGKDGGKDRSKYIPRERFDKINEQNKRVQKLLELGVLQEGTDGELRVNAEALAEATGGKDKKDGQKSMKDFMLTKEEVDELSWPLAQKINGAFDYMNDLANKFAYSLIQLQSEGAILRDYPDFLQKESPLRKRAQEILKNDPEFKKLYKGNPEAAYWAVKRAAELLAGKKGPAPKPKGKGFIVNKGDTGKTAKKVVDFSKMTSAELDKFEREEHDRLQAARATGRK